MKKLIKIIITALLTLCATFTVVSAASLQENLALLNANWEDPVTITQAEKELILSPKGKWSEIIVNVDSYLETLHFYNPTTEVRIDISALPVGEHKMQIQFYKDGKSHETFLGSTFNYSFIVGTSEFEKYGIKYDNLSALSVDPNLETAAHEAIETMFEKFPVLVGTIDSIVLEPATSTFYQANPIAAALTQYDSLLSINSDGITTLGATITLNIASNNTPYLLKNNITHEMAHALTYVLATRSIGIDPNHCNAIEAHYALDAINSRSYERDLRDSILISNGFNLSNISTEIREYASTSDGEFFSNSIAQALTNPAPSKLSLIVLDEVMKEASKVTQ